MNKKKQDDDWVLAGKPTILKIKNKTATIQEFKINQFLLLADFYLQAFSGFGHDVSCKKVYAKNCILINVLLSKTFELLKIDLKVEESLVSAEYLKAFETIVEQNQIIKIWKKTTSDKIESTQAVLPVGVLHTVAQIIEKQLWPGLTLLNYKELLTFGQLDVLTRIVTDIAKLKMLDDRTVLIYAIGACFGNSDKNKKIPELEAMLFGGGEQDTKIETQKVIKRKAFFKERWNDFEFIKNHCEERNNDLEIYYTEEEIKQLS